MKPLLVGQAPGPNTDPGYPLAPLPHSSAGGRLAWLAGLTPKEYLELFQRTNLLHSFPGRWKRDDKWPARDAQIAAAAMKPLLGGRSVILIGRNVADAFGYPAQHLDFHEWFSDPRWGFEVAVVPHTSGRNHWYRKPGNEDAARAFWEEVVARFSVQGPRVVELHDSTRKSFAA